MKKRRDCVVEMRELSFQLEALAYLFSVTGSTGDEKLEEIHWGLGKILERFAKRFRSIANEVERTELLRAKMAK